MLRPSAPRSAGRSPAARAAARARSNLLLDCPSSNTFALCSCVWGLVPGAVAAGRLARRRVLPAVGAVVVLEGAGATSRAAEARRLFEATSHAVVHLGMMPGLSSDPRERPQDLQGAVTVLPPRVVASPARAFRTGVMRQRAGRGALGRDARGAAHAERVDRMRVDAGRPRPARAPVIARPGPGDRAGPRRAPARPPATAVAPVAAALLTAPRSRRPWTPPACAVALGAASGTAEPHWVARPVRVPPPRRPAGTRGSPPWGVSPTRAGCDDPVGGRRVRGAGRRPSWPRGCTEAAHGMAGVAGAAGRPAIGPPPQPPASGRRRCRVSPAGHRPAARAADRSGTRRTQGAAAGLARAARCPGRRDRRRGGLPPRDRGGPPADGGVGGTRRAAAAETARRRPAGRPARDPLDSAARATSRPARSRRAAPGPPPRARGVPAPPGGGDGDPPGRGGRGPGASPPIERRPRAAPRLLCVRRRGAPAPGGPPVRRAARRAGGYR